MTWLDSLETVTPELRAVLEAIGSALRGRMPTPELLKEIVSTYANVVSSHQVIVSHVPKGVLSPRRAFYKIAIKGARIDAQWNLTPGNLVILIQAACPNFTWRLS